MQRERAERIYREVVTHTRTYEQRIAAIERELDAARSGALETVARTFDAEARASYNDRKWREQLEAWAEQVRALKSAPAAETAREARTATEAGIAHDARNAPMVWAQRIEDLEAATRTHLTEIADQQRRLQAIERKQAKIAEAHNGK